MQIDVYIYFLLCLESPVKKAVTFSKDDDIFDGLGLEEKSNTASRPSRSALDDLFGKSSPPPLTFNTDKTEISQAGKLLMGKNGEFTSVFLSLTHTHKHECQPSWLEL